MIKTKISIQEKFWNFRNWIFGLFSSRINSCGKTKITAASGILPPINVSYFTMKKTESWECIQNTIIQSNRIAKKENKPVLIDFTGYGCENCRKMEEFWSEPDILPTFKTKWFWLLYVDDKEELPEAEQTKIDMGNGQMKKLKPLVINGVCSTSEF
jgi:thiol:disulfide interchange protein DsbD